MVTILVSDPSTAGAALTTGNSKAYYRIPDVMNGWDLVDVEASVIDASSSGAVTVMVRNATQAADMLSTPITIDSGETDSSTAASPVIDTGNDDVATGDQIHIDVDAAGTDVFGLEVELQFQAP